MTDALILNDFLNASGVILDVRSPAEFTQGRIPGAINLPLFSNEERALVGTTYKQSGQKNAIELGLKLVGPKLHDFATTAQQHTQDGHVRVHCWRGGMRSSSMAWLLRTVGLKTATLQGGYKTFRRWALNSFLNDYQFHVVGGFTGSGKTAILAELQNMGEQVLDLEALAHHRGSSYGMIGMPEQPTTEQFENEIAFKLNSFDLHRPIWIEDESHLIGRCRVPEGIFSQMQQAPLFLIERPLEERLAILRKEYGHADPQLLIEATKRLERRLGGMRTKEVMQLIIEGRLDAGMEIVLKYYDQAYQYALQRRQQKVCVLKHALLSNAMWANQLRNFVLVH